MLSETLGLIHLVPVCAWVGEGGAEVRPSANPVFTSASLCGLCLSRKWLGLGSQHKPALLGKEAGWISRGAATHEAPRDLRSKTHRSALPRASLSRDALGSHLHTKLRVSSCPYPDGSAISENCQLPLVLPGCLLPLYPSNAS